MIIMTKDLRQHLRETAIWYGGLGLLTVRVARNLALPPSYLWLVAREIDIIGVRSLVVALTAALFTGMVLALQTAVNMARFGAENYVGPVVALSIAARSRNRRRSALDSETSSRAGAVSGYKAAKWPSRPPPGRSRRRSG